MDKQKSGTRRTDGSAQMFWTLFPMLTLSNGGTSEKQALAMMNFAIPEGPARAPR